MTKENEMGDKEWKEITDLAVKISTFGNNHNIGIFITALGISIALVLNRSVPKNAKDLENARGIINTLKSCLLNDLSGKGWK